MSREQPAGPPRDLRVPVFGLMHLDGVECAGPEARGFLQGQVSQDLEQLDRGDAAPALLLSPQGKLEAVLEVVCIGPDAFVCATESGRGEAVEARLRRFKIRVKAELARRPLLGLLGLGERAHAEELESVLAAAARRLDPEVPSWTIAPSWSGLEVRVLLAPADTAAELTAGLDLAPAETLEYLRVAAGVPRWGRELDESTIAAEAGLVEKTVSFTKGCYTGQELVARLDARGSNVARRLYRVRPSAAHASGVGDRLLDGERVLGELTSVAVGTEGDAVALGYFRRGAPVPGEVTLVGPHGEYAARVLDPV